MWRGQNLNLRPSTRVSGSVFGVSCAGFRVWGSCFCALREGSYGEVDPDLRLSI